MNADFFYRYRTSDGTKPVVTGSRGIVLKKSGTAALSEQYKIGVA